MYAQNKENLFKKWLIDEVKAKSMATYKEIYDQVDAYSKTHDYQLTFQKWKKIYNKKIFSDEPIKHVLAGFNI